MSSLDSIVSELEHAAARLRAGELEGQEAAELVEHVAEFAGRVGSQLEREARAAAAEPGDRQESLL